MVSFYLGSNQVTQNPHASFVYGSVELEIISWIEGIGCLEMIVGEKNNWFTSPEKQNHLLSSHIKLGFMTQFVKAFYKEG